MQLTFSCSIPVAREPLFAFHTNPENLSVLLAEWPATEVVRTAGHIAIGARTEVRERVGPVTLRCTFEHHVFEAPERFGERQVRGIFRCFEHVHEFHVEGPECTRIVDKMDVRLPWWLGGAIADRLIAKPRLARIFALRARAYERLAAEGRFR